MQPPSKAFAARRETGFTLVEIMVVVVIVGMLATMVAVNVDRIFPDAKRNTALSECRSIFEGASYFKRTKQRAPTLADLFVPDDTGEAILAGGSPDDPWGNRYIVRELDHGRFEVISMGDDGLEDTVDDIVFRPRSGG